ncbi:MAG TPA: hypothetical protein VHF47_01420 [Acidimicrobiales bacterium]|nr:hypothetical protein [Acidimicrobiales bacterium]
MPVQCESCGLELPLPAGPLTTCPRCAPNPEVAGRIVAELVEAALERSDQETVQQLLSSADAWRDAARGEKP